MLMTLFSQTVEVQTRFLGDLQKLKELQIGQGNITVTPGFTMLLIKGLIESKESGVIALELIPANTNAEKLFTELVGLLSPLTDDIESLGYSWMDYNCGIVKSDHLTQFEGSYIVTIPAGNGDFLDFLEFIDGLSQNESRPSLFLLLFIQA